MLARMEAPALVIELLLLLASAMLLAKACVLVFAEHKAVDALFPAAMGIGILWEAVQPHIEMTLGYALIFVVVALLLGGLPLFAWLRSRGAQAQQPPATEPPPESPQT